MGRVWSIVPCVLRGDDRALLGLLGGEAEETGHRKRGEGRRRGKGEEEEKRREEVEWWWLWWGRVKWGW